MPGVRLMPALRGRLVGPGVCSMRTAVAFGLLCWNVVATCAEPLVFDPVAPATDQALHLPGNYRYEILVRAGDELPGGGIFPERNDMNAFVPVAPGRAHLVVNHELRPGRITILTLQKAGRLWNMVASRSARVPGGTWNNCGGNATPWGTVLSAEEYPPVTRLQLLSHLARGISMDPGHYGWMVEIDPATGQGVKRRGLGRFSHENAAVMPDRRTVYMGEDRRDGALYKFVAEREGDLSRGALYVLDAEGRRWLSIPHEDLRDARGAAHDLGATRFDRLEEVEYNAADGMLYIAETGDIRKSGPDRYGRVWRLDPRTLAMEVFLQGRPDGVVNPDNLAVEPGTGRLLVHEDRYDELRAPTAGMPNNSLWVVDHEGHAMRFASIPRGGEPTGGAFAPDGTLFFSVQHPDAPWRSSVVQVIAREPGKGTSKGTSELFN